MTDPIQTANAWMQHQMSQQPEALRLADDLDADPMVIGYEQHAAELRRLHQHELANSVWNEKTEWVQQTAQPHELGMHRADVLRQRIDRLHIVNAQLLEALGNLEEYSKRMGNVASNLAAAKEKV